MSSRNYYYKHQHWLPVRSPLPSLRQLRRARNFCPLISGGSPRHFPYFPRPQRRPSPSSRCERRESSRKRRSQRFLRRTIVPHPAVPPLSPSDLCRSIRRLTKQVVTPLRERLTRACHYLLAALSRLVKGATFISPVWSQSSKSSFSRFSLIPRTTKPSR